MRVQNYIKTPNVPAYLIKMRGDRIKYLRLGYDL